MKDQEKIPENIQAAGNSLPFVVPELYFENLPGRIQDRLPEADGPLFSKVIHAVRPHLAMAAMFIGLIAVGYA
ncbi:hypothetical protein ACFLTU_10440, partial [Bacteroidota bacterium]